MQIKKDAIEKQIKNAARIKFAEKGFKGVSMRDIAQKAGVSVGNIYHYYNNKEALFNSIITPAFVDEFKLIITEKTRSIVALDQDGLGNNPSIILLSDEYFNFISKYRLEFIILLGNAHGTKYENEHQNIINMFVETAISFAESTIKESITEEKRFLICVLYSNMFQSMIDILIEYEHRPAIKELIKSLTLYHIQGLRAMMDELIVHY